MEWATYLSRIDTGVGGRYHTGALATDPDVFDAVIAELCEPFRGEPIDAVAGIDALGFVFGTAVSLLEAAGGAVADIAVVGADDSAPLLRLRERYTVHALNRE